MSIRTPKEIQEEIIKNQEATSKLLGELQEAQRRDPFVFLADMIHKKTCKTNHIDGCGYEYEGDHLFLNEKSSKGRYYKRAKALVNDSGFDVQICLKVITALK